MGTKRVGLARTQALIENLKRELQMNSSTLKDVNVQMGQDNVVTVSSASKDLAASETGSVVELHRAAGATVKMPENATTGMRFTIMVRTITSSGAYVINAGTGNTFSTSSFIIQQDVTASSHHTVLRPNDGNDVTLTMTFNGTNKTAQLGTVFELECVAAGKWRITGNHHIDASGTGVFA